jgi:hypothetical protein
MRRLTRPILIALTLMLMLWVVSGPIGMAFDGCAMMGAMCEAPCGISSYIAGPVATSLAGLQPLAYLASSSTARPLLVTA